MDTVLTGTLLRAGAQLRLTTQLVEAPSGTLIWSKASQVELRDIFQLQDTLVSGVVESLALPLTAGERQQLAHDAPASASAYDLYLRANEAGKAFSGFSEAIGLYEQCVALDPGYAPAWARLGRARWLVGKFSEGAGGEAGGRAQRDRAGAGAQSRSSAGAQSVHEHPGGPRPRDGCDEASAEAAAQFEDRSGIVCGPHPREPLLRSAPGVARGAIVRPGGSIRTFTPR